MGVSPKRALEQRRRSTARLHAVQALFQMEASGTPLEEIGSEFETHRFGTELHGEELEEADSAHFRELIDGAVNHQATIDQQTDVSLVAKWPIQRIDPTIRAIFRAGLAELLTCDTPPKVVMNEYVELTRAFFPEGREPSFVNAVLDHAARALKPDAFAA